MSALKTKGIFLKALVNSVKNERGDAGVKQLEQVFGNINFSGFKDYPVETEIDLNKAVIKVLYGKESPQTWEKFGRLGFRTYVENPIGRTMFSLFGNDFKKLVMSVGKVFDTVTSGYEVSVEDVSENKVKIIMGNCLDEKEYYIGLFSAAVEYFGYKPNVSVQVLGKNNYEYSVEWSGIRKPT